MQDLFTTKDSELLISAIKEESLLLIRNHIQTLGQEKHIRRIHAMAEYGSPLTDEMNFQQPTSNNLVGSVFVAAWGATMRLNTFAIVLAETEKTAILYELSSYTVSGGINQGSNMPLIPFEFNHLLGSEKAYRMRKNIADEKISFSREFQTFKLWDGTPMQFWGD